MLFAIGALSTFLIGGCTGIFLGSAAVDIYLHGTYFVVAHFHYTLMPAVFFGGFTAVYFWFPKMFGRMMHETLGKIHFWLTFVFFNLTFFPMHFLGLAGMPRRIPDYPDAFAGWNLVCSVGAVISAVGVLLFFVVLWRTFAAGERIAANPWGAGATTLEWTVPSPAPFHTFEELPHVEPQPAE
jgi:cytochrome c oxidase subunit 1